MMTFTVGVHMAARHERVPRAASPPRLPAPYPAVRIWRSRAAALQTRSFCFVDDLIRGIVLLAESREHLPVNLGNPDEKTLLELAEFILRLTGSASEIVYEALPVDDPQVRQPDITRAKQILGWEPEIALEDGLRKTIASLGHEAAVGSA